MALAFDPNQTFFRGMWYYIIEVHVQVTAPIRRPSYVSSFLCIITIPNTYSYNMKGARLF